MNDLPDLSLYDCQKLDELISKTQTSIDNAPEGTLRICQRNGRTYYYRRLSGSKETAVYIRKEDLVLARRSIPYKYECPLTLGKRTIYPDFTILDIKKRKVIYLEHFGRMDDPEYANDFVRKINFYEANRIFPGDSLIMTFESSRIALDTAVADLLIENCLI